MGKNWFQSIYSGATRLERAYPHPRQPLDDAAGWGRLHLCVVLVALLIPSASHASENFVELPRDLEIELALSALPAELRDGAAIFVRNPEKGFVLHRKGTNNWATFVARTSVRFYAADWEYRYPSDQLIPQAHDAIGQAHHMLPYFDLERMRIDGVPASEAKTTMRTRFSDGTYTAPSRGGLSYMLAPLHRAYRAPAESGETLTISFPHHIPYAPHVVANDLGTMDPQGRSGILDHGGHDAGPHGFLYFAVQPDQAAKTRTTYAALLDRLCAHHKNWCLPKDSQQHSAQ